MRPPAPSTARRRTAWWPLVLTALLLTWALPSAPAQATPQPQPRPNREHRHSVHHKRHHSPRLSQQAKTGRYGGGEARLGTLRTWPTVDWSQQTVLREFRLRAVTEHAEIWVPTGDLPVDTDDCSSSNADDLVITDPQLRYLGEQFEHVIRPREAKVFGVPRPRDGSHAKPELLDPSIPPDAWRGKGDRVVVLVDNIASGGEFISADVDATDRNILIIEAAGWKTMLGARPANLGGSPCRIWEGFPMPNYIEGLLAHEYNHVLWYSGAQDPNGANWTIEGTAEWARWLVGYDDRSEDALKNLKIGCFQGRQRAMFPAGYTDPYGDRNGGPENSLTLWPDPGQSFLCDYGASEVMIHTLSERHGHGFVRDLLYAGGGSGFERLAKTLARHGAHEDPFALLRDWSTTAALDGILDDGAELTGADPRRFRAKALHSTVNLDTPFAYARPGAPSNGADFVRLRDASGRPLTASALRSLDFEAPLVYPTRPVEWTVDPDGHAPGDPALYSGPPGDEVSIDRSIVREITVDPADPTLTFDARWDIEPGYDLGAVQVSTDGGATFTSRRSAGMVTTLNGDAASDIAALLPGFTGDSGGWTHQSIDLSDLAGRTVLVAFRYKTDASVIQPGLWIDNIKSGATLVSDGSSLAGWQTISSYQIHTIPGISLRLVAYTDDHQHAWTADVPLDANHHGALDQRRLRRLLGTQAKTVFAIIDHYEPTESIKIAAPYRLTVNGVLQPGGS
ncbi:immune inhibitor A peptidase M6 [Streptomyces sp. Ag109_G2-6]|uniref:choice-of-anchor J domain-containing protein n=1 Tax=Streptomyces TaxID=1883 RepID=UPI0009A5490C|nr:MULTISPECIES: choice-of-anchor J domain-containing protein [Streptomyces]RPF40355.1 immune inhibitor A peptidase M6 [Streptomyces sp. Ag109_G2-6]